MPEQIIHRTEIPGIDLVPDSRHAMKYNNAEPWAAARDLQIGLRDVVEAVRDRYDMVLIDCPPNLHLCSWAALVASDFLIVPLQPEDYGAGDHRRPGIGGAGHLAGQPRPVAPGLLDHDVQRPQVDSPKTSRLAIGLKDDPLRRWPRASTLAWFKSRSQLRGG